MFTQLKLSTDQIAAEAQRARDSLAAIHGAGGDAATYAAQVLAHRLAAFPERYIEFGPYWWGVKRALRAHGAEFGSADDGTVGPEYGGALEPLEAMSAGELFKEYYRRNYLAGAAQFWLDDEGEESYVLFDPDMEARRVGRRGGLLAALDLAPSSEAPEPENRQA